MKILSILAKSCLKIEIEPSRSALFDTNTKVCLIYFGQDCSSKGKIGRKFLGSVLTQFSNR